MVLKLYGYPITTCTKRVRVVFDELKVPYEFVSVDIFKDEHKTSDYMVHQPFAQIPYIDDDGFQLFESRAICRYAALKYGGVGTLIPDPADVQQTARFEQAASIELSNFDPAASGLAYEVLFYGIMRGTDPNPHIVKLHETTLERKLGGYEALLSQQKYIAGDELTLVDLFHLSYGAMLDKMNYDYLRSEKYPNIARWWKDISSRPTWLKINAEAPF